MQERHKLMYAIPASVLASLVDLPEVTVLHVLSMYTRPVSQDGYMLAADISHVLDFMHAANRREYVDHLYLLASHICPN